MRALTLLFTLAIGWALLPAGGSAVADEDQRRLGNRAGLLDARSPDAGNARDLVREAAGVDGRPSPGAGSNASGHHPSILRMPVTERGLLVGDFPGREAFASRQDPCWREQWLDPAGDVSSLDVVAHSAGYYCAEDVWLHAALTDDDWPTSDLGAYFLDISTTGDPAEGCEGFDYLVFGFQEQGQLLAGVLETPECDGDTWTVAGPAFLGRAGATDFISVVFDFSLIGSPPRHWFYGGLASADGDEIDLFPDESVYELSGYPASDGPQPPPADVSSSCPAGRVPSAGFDDIAGNAHEATVDCVAWWGLTQGVSATSYAPRRTVNRGQMATFVVALIRESGGTLPPPQDQGFTDVAGNTHEDAINQLAAAGVVSGTTATTYAPNRPVRRDQMTTFLVSAYRHLTGVQLRSEHDYFDDIAQSTHRENVNAAAEAGFTSGTGPRQFSPIAAVRRDQMASFLARTLNRLVDDGVASPPGS